MPRSAGRDTAGQAPGHGVDRGPPDHRLGALGVAFIVPGQPAVRGDPGEGPFHCPPAWDHRETLLIGGFADHRDSDA